MDSNGQILFQSYLLIFPSHHLILISFIMNIIAKLFYKPIVPLLIINSALNQEKTVNLLQKLKKVNYANAKAIGLVVEINNHMPVQIDKIAQFLNSVRNQYKLNIYGFCHSHVSAESYYLLSNADRVYTMPSTIFQLSKGVRIHSAETLMANLGIKKTTIKTHQDLIGAGLDSFTSANTSKYLNQKMTQINQRLHQFSTQNRKARNSSIALDPSPPLTMIGVQAIERGYVDGTGSYFDILKNIHPECTLQHVRIKQKISTRTLQLLIASPIIIILFLLKVLLKYSIIMYLWISHKNSKQQ